MTLAAFLAALDAVPIDLIWAALVRSPEYHVSVIHPISKIIVIVEITSNTK
jgi:hypothetical protein